MLRLRSMKSKMGICKHFKHEVRKALKADEHSFKKEKYLNLEVLLNFYHMHEEMIDETCCFHKIWRNSSNELQELLDLTSKEQDMRGKGCR